MPPAWLTAHLPLFRQALRMAVAATLAMAAVELLRLPSGFWAPLSALAVLQGQIGASFVAARNYVIANVTGVLLGALIVATLGKQLLVAGAGIFLVAALATAMRLPPASASVACGIIPVLVLSVSGDPWRYGGHRILDILIGMASAIAVSFLLFPVRAVVQLRQAVGGTVRDASCGAAGAVEALVAGGAPVDAGVARSQFGAGLQTARALLPAARLETPHWATTGDSLAGYVSDGDYIVEHATAVIELTADQPRAAVTALASHLQAVGESLRAAGTSIGEAIAAGVAGRTIPAVRKDLASLHGALTPLRAPDLMAVAQGEDLLRLHSLARALADLADELERAASRIERPGQAQFAEGRTPAADTPAPPRRRQERGPT
jgi:hypothetical protein